MTSEATHLLVVSSVFSTLYLGFSSLRTSHLRCGGAASSVAAIGTLATARMNGTKAPCTEALQDCAARSRGQPHGLT